MSYSVVIPSRTATNVMRACSMIRAAGETCRIIVVDDGINFDLIPNGWGFHNGAPIRVEGAKPFCFAKNVNLGIAAAGEDDVILMNDDAGLQTPDGFRTLELLAHEGTIFPAMPHHPIGMVGPSTEQVGNVRQLRRKEPTARRIRWEPRMLCFVCAYIPRHVLRKVGPLDERFVGYGMDDDDYSLRVRQAGYSIGITDDVFVDHGHVPSSFRGAGGAGGDFTPNLQLFIEKHGHDNHGLNREQSNFRSLFPRKM